MFLEAITLKNVLSFKDATIELGPLNVLIGANAAGKSNLIEVVNLLKAAPRDLLPPIGRGGGVSRWIWMGATSPVARVECMMKYEAKKPAVRYHLEFHEESQSLVILSEWLSDAARSRARQKPRLYFDRHGVQVVTAENGKRLQQTIKAHESVLSRWKNPFDPTPISQLGRELERVRIFTEFRPTGMNSELRTGITTSARKEFVDDGGANLAVVLYEMDFLGFSDLINKHLKRFCDRFEDVKVRLNGGVAEAQLQETGLLERIPGLRMSDGTLKFLCLLVVLLNPEPPPLLCIEEPELGLHPDALQIVAGLLIEASERTQLIVTTHSEALIDALSSRPETVLVCERHVDNGAQMKRLSKKQLSVWLKRYSLRELWRNVEIGRQTHKWTSS